MVKAILKIQRGHRAGDEIALNEAVTQIGCDFRNNLLLADPAAALFHAVIRRRGRMFMIEDLKSQAGTFINGDRVRNAVLKHGDRIIIGSAELVFQAVEDTGVDTSHSDKVQPLIDLGICISSTDAAADAGHVFLKGVSKLLPTAARAAFLIWDGESQRLRNLVSQEFLGNGTFHATDAMFKEAVRSKTLLTYDAEPTHHDRMPWQITLLPLLQGQQFAGVLHIESLKNPGQASAALAPIQALWALSASHFELMRIRVEQDLALSAFVRSISRSLEAKDTYTGGHVERVARYSLAMADELSLDRETKRYLLMSAMCHDIGKLAISDAILRKPDILSAEEFQEMKAHPEIGEKILVGIPNLSRFVSGVRSHHERWDGTGYPDGLRGEEIPFFARIIGITDAFDAIVSGRSYSGFTEVGAAIEYMLEREDLFDADLLKVFAAAYHNGKLTLRTDTQHYQKADGFSLKTFGG